MYYVYILRSLKIKRCYVGVTTDIGKRLHDHNKGWTKSTKPYIPWKLIYREEFSDKYEAYKREYYLKSTKGYLEKKSIVDRFTI